MPPVLLNPSRFGAGGGGGGGYAAAVLADSPMVYLKLDETSGTSIADSSGNGRTFTAVNSPTLGAASLLPSDPSGKSVEFTGAGSNAKIRCASNAWMNNASGITVEAWISPDNLTHVGIIVSRHSFGTGGGDDWYLRINNGVINWVCAGRTTSYTLPSLGTYHVVAGTNTTVGHFIYTQGVSRATQGFLDGAGTTAQEISIGKASYFNDNDTNLPFDGKIDSVAIYPTLALARIPIHYAAA